MPDVSVAIKGPNAKGKVYFLTEKRNEIKTYLELDVRIDNNNEVINFLDENLDSFEAQTDF